MSERMFVAVLVYEASSSRGERVFEESVTLLVAESAQRAAEKARAHAEAREATHRTSWGEEITWRFRQLADLTEVAEPLGDGAEVYTKHFRDYRAYLAVEPLAS